MFMKIPHTKILLILIPATIILLAALALFSSLPGVAENRLHHTLATLGIYDTRIGQTNIAGGQVYYENIQLDSDGFSIIGTMIAQPGKTGLLLRQPYRRLTFDNIVLTGEFDPQGTLDIAGWQHLPQILPPYDEILINTAQLDLITPSGAIRLEGRAQSLRDPNGALKILANIGGVQHQLKLHTKWNGLIAGPEQWQIEVALEDGRVHLENFSTSRVNGWVTALRDKSAPPAFSSQLDMGSLQFGELALSAMNITFEGTLAQWQLIARGLVGRYQNMSLFTDITYQGPDEILVTAMIETRNLNDLLSFLKELRHSATLPVYSQLLQMPQLLSEENLNRVARDVRRAPHDTLELQVTGLLNDLTGKIIAKRDNDGVTERRIISLNPRERVN